MNILITGATGFIGSHVTRALIAQGHQVRACVRQPADALDRWPECNPLTADFLTHTETENWLPLLEGIDVVINAVGIIQQTGEQTFEKLHALAPIALFDACSGSGVRKVIQISALGVDTDRPAADIGTPSSTRYQHTKYRADEHLRQLDINWTILRPSMVYGSGAASMAFFKALAALPFTPLIGGGQQKLQPVHVSDLVKLVINAVETAQLDRQILDVAGPAQISVQSLYSQLRHWLDGSAPRFVNMPMSLAVAVSPLARALDLGPIDRESLQMLQQGNTADIAPMIPVLGKAPRSLEKSLQDTPAQQSDRWHARLWFLQPLLRLSIATVWIFAAIASVWLFPASQSHELLAQTGLTGKSAMFALYGAAVLDLLIGLATLVRYRPNIVIPAQLVLIVFYTIVISVALPFAWAQPFGAIIKNFPLFVATLVLWVMESR